MGPGPDIRMNQSHSWSSLKRSTYILKMTVHMIRLWSEPPNNDTHLTNIRRECESWVSRYPETLTNQRLAVTHIPATPISTAHTVGHWRFDSSADVNTLLTDLETSLQSVVSYYRIRYHACDHDDSSPSGCSWDESQTREYGTVPEGIP